MLERLSPGGQVLMTDWVENYPGFPDGISGFDLMDKMRRQAEKFGLDIKSTEVSRLDVLKEKRILATDNGNLESKAIILACGATPQRLGIEGESLLTGKGVSYCATCDGPFYREQEVAVIGGGDTAVEEALFLTKFASKIYLVHRRDKLRATKLLQERAWEEEKIEIIWDSIPKTIVGEAGVEGIDLKNVKTGEESHLPVQGVFVFIGYRPNNELVKGVLECDERGFVVTSNNMETSETGIFAAGDITSKLLRQISTAVGDGATAAFAAERYLESLK
jgi:thioredoxin reductase (NADPH)